MTDIKVKLLEWNGRGSFSNIGVYQIVTDDAGDFGFRCTADVGVTFWHWESEAEAKAAAQVDFERRVLASIEVAK